MTTILAGGQPLTLLPGKAAFLAASRTLLIADAHIGKAVTFRALGVPVPHGTTGETLAALSALIATWRQCSRRLSARSSLSRTSQRSLKIGVISLTPNSVAFWIAQSMRSPRDRP